jgi:major membrane immunogen (membrane-anchored lipoprotein)
MNMNVKLGIVALTSVLLLASCGGTDPIVNPPAVTVGTIALPANPNGYTLTIRDSAGTLVDPSKYNSLTPGAYTATYSKDGFASETQNFTAEAGKTTKYVAPNIARFRESTGIAPLPVQRTFSDTRSARLIYRLTAVYLT